MDLDCQQHWKSTIKFDEWKNKVNSTVLVSATPENGKTRILKFY